MRRVGIVLLAVFLCCLAVFALGVRDTYFATVTEVEITDTVAGHEPIRIAVLSDLQALPTDYWYSRIDGFVDEITRSKPDIILMPGDYNGLWEHDPRMDDHRVEVALRLGRLAKVAPTFGIIGNHEVWSNAALWTLALETSGVSMIDHQVVELMVNGAPICVRGLGDVFTGQYQYIEFPETCAKNRKLTLTHDPMAAFLVGSYPGLMVAGHTHCGQGWLPIVGAPWTPTDAPEEAWCGLYQDQGRLLWTTSGIGMSTLPFRFGARASWDLIVLR